jgi:hypothetical protein
MLLGCPEHKVGIVLLTERVGTGFTVTEVFDKLLTQPLADAVTPYVTEPEVLPVALVSDCAMEVDEVLLIALAPFALLGEMVHE